VLLAVDQRAGGGVRLLPGATVAAQVAPAVGLDVVGGVVEFGVANAAGLHSAALQPGPALLAYLMEPLKYQRQVTTTTI
jgi:hypothetical protein